MRVERNEFPDCWLLPDGLTVTDLAAKLKVAFRRSVTHEKRQQIVLHDTFAWQLWQKGLLLCQQDRMCVLCPEDRLSCDEAIAECSFTGKFPRFWWDWTAGAFRETLRSLTGPRALIPVADLSVITQRINLQNEDEKTVARVVIQRYSRTNEEQVPGISLCRVVAIRGYDADARRAVEILHNSGFPQTETPPLELILQQSGRRPEPWNAKPSLALAPLMTAREAIQKLAAFSLDICRRCEAGIIHDIDTEFLHDYRISLRRLRAALKLVKAVYPEEMIAPLLNELKELARQTNRLRDLDVYLLNREEYRGAVPLPMASGLEEMFDDLRAERQTQQRFVAEQLRSSKYQVTMKQLQDSFHPDQGWPVTLNSHTTVSRVANQIIPRQYRKVCRVSALLTEQSPDEAVHAVRLEAKKLRYLLELFGECCQPQLITKLIKQLKSVQDVLGGFNDLAVQQESLQEYVGTKSHSGRQSASVILSVGSLVGVLHHRQQEIRDQVFDRVAVFGGEDMQMLVGDIFNEERKAA